MAGPTRTEPSTSARPSPVPPKPPRPANSWIIYRSEMHKQLSGQKLPQAEVSRQISERWKTLDTATRQHYERLADIRKLEHAAMYPGYVFRPMKKEEKARQREEAKLQKKSMRESIKRNPPPPIGPIPAATVLSPTPAPQVVHADGVVDVLVQRHGPFGPTPPLSAAPSPVGSSASPVARVLTIEQPIPSSYVPLPSYYRFDLQDQSSTHMSSAGQKVDTASVPEPNPSSPVTSSSSKIPTRVISGEWQPSHSQQQLLTPVSATTPLPPNMSWPDVSRTEQSMNDATVENTGVQATPNNVIFDLSQFAMTNGQLLFSDNSSGFEVDSLQALLSQTDDPAVFRLDNFDSTSITQEPQGPIEVVVGHMPFSFDQSTIFPADYDFTNAFNMNSHNPSTSSNGNQQFSPFDNSSQFGSYYPIDGTGMLSNEFNNFHMDEFLTFDDGSSHPPTSHPPTPAVDYHPEMHASTSSTPAPYIPPAGAAYSSTRRVAGSWKPPIDNSPPRAWGVQAS